MEVVMLPIYTPIVTLLAVAFYFFLATRVAVAHGKFSVKLPATIGNPDFERIFRAHMNTLEWMPTFLLPLWLCAVYLSDVAAAALGLVWVLGRAVYFSGYSRAVEKRLPGFFIQATVCLLLFLGAAVGVVVRLLGD
jgi:glutathione S-transferase